MSRMQRSKGEPVCWIFSCSARRDRSLGNPLQRPRQRRHPSAPVVMWVVVPHSAWWVLRLVALGLIQSAPLTPEYWHLSGIEMEPDSRYCMAGTPAVAAAHFTYKREDGERRKAKGPRIAKDMKKGPR